CSTATSTIPTVTATTPTSAATTTAPTAATATGGGTETVPGQAAYEVKSTPNYVSSQDSPGYANGIWIYPQSPTTPYVGPDSIHRAARYMLLDPRYTDSAGHAGSDDWWFVIERNWPASFDPYRHGDWGREDNFHTVAGDAGPAGSGGVGWGF